MGRKKYTIDTMSKLYKHSYRHALKQLPRASEYKGVEHSVFIHVVDNRPFKTHAATLEFVFDKEEVVENKFWIWKLNRCIQS